MNCQQFQCQISEWIDAELEKPLEVDLRGHLDNCHHCSSVYRDLMAIKSCPLDLEAFEPPIRVWKGIEARLYSEGLIQSKRGWRIWEKIFPLGLDATFKPALAGALVTLLLVASSYVVFRNSFWKEPAQKSSAAVVLNELQDAEAHYVKAIDALHDVSQQKLQSLDPHLAKVFNDNLATMDYYLKECQEAVKTNPDNPLVQRYLLAAYQKKVELLETIVNSDTL
jgi:hypothetical protein